MVGILEYYSRQKVLAGPSLYADCGFSRRVLGIQPGNYLFRSRRKIKLEVELVSLLRYVAPPQLCGVAHESRPHEKRHPRLAAAGPASTRQLTTDRATTTSHHHPHPHIRLHHNTLLPDYDNPRHYPLQHRQRYVHHPQVHTAQLHVVLGSVSRTCSRYRGANTTCTPLPHPGGLERILYDHV